MASLNTADCYKLTNHLNLSQWPHMFITQTNFPAIYHIHGLLRHVDMTAPFQSKVWMEYRWFQPTIPWIADHNDHDDMIAPIGGIPTLNETCFHTTRLKPFEVIQCMGQYDVGKTATWMMFGSGSTVNECQAMPDVMAYIEFLYRPPKNPPHEQVFM